MITINVPKSASTFCVYILIYIELLRILYPEIDLLASRLICLWQVQTYFNKLSMTQ